MPFCGVLIVILVYLDRLRDILINKYYFFDACLVFNLLFFS